MRKQWTLIISLSVFFVITSFLLFDLRKEFQKENGHVRGTILWIATEVDREYWRFIDALNRYSLGDITTTQDDLLLRFDILWSQFNTFKSGDLGKQLISAGNAEKTVLEIEKTFNNIEPILNELNHGDYDTGIALRDNISYTGTLIHAMVQRIDKSENQYFVETFNSTEQTISRLSLLLFAMSISAFVLILLLIKEKQKVQQLLIIAENRQLEIFENNIQLEERVANRTQSLQKEIIKRKKNERSLQKSEERLNMALEAVSDAIWDWRIDTGDVHFNPGWYRILGYEPYELPEAYSTWKNLIHPDDQGKTESVISKHLGSNERFVMEYRMKSKNGEWNWMLGRGKVVDRGDNDEPLRLIGTNTDITKQKLNELNLKANEEKIHQSQRIEAIGTLAGGIAHDFNNILAAIIGYSEMARDDSIAGKNAVRSLEKVLEGANRAKELVQQILAFSRQTTKEKIPLKPQVIVTEVLKMLRPSLPSTIEIQQDINYRTGPILADPGEIHQVLMNLCTNAFHAMESSGGNLSISLKELTLSNKEVNHEPDVEPGHFVQISISDSGQGITQDIAHKIFDPYFTTKDKSKGTGLGLSIVHGIVKSCNGFVSFNSEIGEGTTFDVYLPIIKSELQPELSETKPVPFGVERILFIDDEIALAEMTQNRLERLGYNVTIKNNSIEALEIFENQPYDFDLVITDHTMPFLTGADLAREMIQIRTDIPIILCTGYSSNISREKALSIGIKEFALKPLSKNELAVLIRKALQDSDVI